MIKGKSCYAEEKKAIHGNFLKVALIKVKVPKELLTESYMKK
jgi:hypothetical protein